jgi:uncharacterized Zn finger protein (UPF0148 family)
MSSDERDENPDLGLRSAADALTKGGILIREPCDVCKGVQVKFKDELRCVNCGRVTREHQPVIMPEQNKTDDLEKISNHTHSDTHFTSKFQKIAITSIERRIMELTSDIKYDNSISDEIAKAQLIDNYLSILERFMKLRHRK